MTKAFTKLEKKIEHSEKKVHPNYSKEHIKYIGQATAGRIARARRAKRMVSA
jgi:hypothetical protein